MVIPIYDETILPCFTYPLTNTQTESKRGFGSKAITSYITASLKLMIETDADMVAVYNFWKNDCIFGLDPFIIDLPIFGGAIGEGTGLLVRFKDDFTSKKDNGIWEQTINIEVIGNVVYVVDDYGDVILSDDGDVIVSDGNYVVTENITSYKGITYGS